MPAPLVSIVINNYNYGEFLGAAIESALDQSYAPVEVLVVDDGSTDGSREVIARYGPRVVPILKANGGQASAFNAGVAASTGRIICFLDSDDLFYRDKVSETVALFIREPYETKPLFVSHQLEIIDRQGVPRRGRIGGRGGPPLNLYAYAKRYRFTYAPCGPTTGMSLNRVLADRIFPLPEEGLRVGADDFVRRAASLIGDCHAIDRVLGGYRVHGENRWYGTPDERIGPLEHVRNLQAYLNRLLLANELEPVISFHESMYYCVHLAESRQWAALPKQALRAIARHPDLHTLRFMYLLAADTIRRSLRERRLPAQTR